MKYILIVLAAGMFASCSSHGSREVPFKAKQLLSRLYPLEQIEADNYEILYVDSSFNAGDTVKIEGRYYALKQRVK